MSHPLTSADAAHRRFSSSRSRAEDHAREHQSGPPQHAVDDQPVIHPPAATPRRSIRQQRLQPRPFLSGQIMTIKHDKVLPAHPLKIHETRPSPREATA
jgi:hypothetical protein